MQRLSKQKEIIVAALRPMKWVCGSEWIGRIKDDRIRITELNRGYMADKGFKIVGEPCKGRSCGEPHCPLFRRKAVKLEAIPSNFPYQPAAPITIYKDA